MTFGDKIKALRQDANLSLREVEAVTGIYQSKLSDWEEGREGRRGSPTRKQLLALSRLFGVTLEYLCDDERDDPGQPATTPSAN